MPQPPPRHAPQRDQAALRCVAQGVADLARRAQDERVVALGEHLPAPLPDLVQPLRDPDREPLHASRERHSVARLDDHVHVVRLHRVMVQPELPVLLAVLQGLAHDGVGLLAPQALEPFPQTHRHVHGEALLDLAAPAMGHGAELALALLLLRPVVLAVAAVSVGKRESLLTHRSSSSLESLAPQEEGRFTPRSVTEIRASSV